MGQILQKNCLVCSCLFQKPYYTGLPEWNRRRYCSVKCKDNSPRSQETRLKQRLAKIGKPSWNKGKKLSSKHRKNLLGKKKPWTEEMKRNRRELYRSGKIRPWNKIDIGITPINERIRKSPEYKQWRKKVFERDNYTCQKCGRRGGNLHADHIKPFALFESLRFELTNGQTLCISCHRKTESYGINQWTMK